MSSGLATQYQRQERWRHWDEAIRCVPLAPGQRILDLGCGVGQMAARFQRLGAQVIGVDSNHELLDAARSLYPDVRFEKMDVRELAPSLFGRVDGIWASFSAAYLSNLESIVAQWSDCIVPGGWMSLVEMDDLFGHQPLPSPFKDAITKFYASANAAGRYDFLCGHRLVGAAKRAGLTIIHEGVLPDDELTFQGPASSDVLEAWQLRLKRMGGLKEFLGPRFPEFERAFLLALASSAHRSDTRVFIVVSRRPSNQRAPAIGDRGTKEIGV